MIFWLCYEGHDKPKPWGVRLGKQWQYADRVSLSVLAWTVYRGPRAAQPKAYLTGHCESAELNRNGVMVIQ